MPVLGKLREESSYVLVVPSAMYLYFLKWTDRFFLSVLFACSPFVLKRITSI